MCGPRREAASLVGTGVKVHPGGAGALKKRPENHRQAPWRFDQQASSGCCVARTAIGFWLSSGQAGDGPEGRKLLSSLSVLADHLAMDRAWQGDGTPQRVWDMGLVHVVPPKRSCLGPGIMNANSPRNTTRWNGSFGGSNDSGGSAHAMTNPTGHSPSSCNSL